MVEKITADAFREGFNRLKENGVLSPHLTQDLQILAESMEKVAHFEEGKTYLEKARIKSIDAAGPMSKVFRLLACILENIEKHATELSNGGWSVDRASLLDVESGCSTYSGRVVVRVRNDEGKNQMIIDGPFLWDCAAHDRPQTEAAKQLGYRCIVHFPECKLPPEDSGMES